MWLGVALLGQLEALVQRDLSALREVLGPPVVLGQQEVLVRPGPQARQERLVQRGARERREAQVLQGRPGPLELALREQN